MPQYDPYQVIAISTMMPIAINLASNFVDRWVSRLVGPSVEKIDDHLGNPMKNLNFFPDKYIESLSKSLKDAINIYLEKHPEYSITGVHRFLSDRDVQNEIIKFFTSSENLDTSKLQEKLAIYFNVNISATDKILAKRRGIDLEKIVNDFLEACEQSFIHNLNNPHIREVYTLFRTQRQTRSVVQEYSKGLTNHFDTRFDQLESRFAPSSAGAILQSAQWVEVISEDADETIVKLRQAYSIGNTQDARDEIEKLKEPKRWSGIKEEIKAEILAFQAIIALQIDKDIEHSIILLNEAESLYKIDRITTLRALIAHHSGNTQVALSLLHGLTDIRSISIRLSILIDSNQIDEIDAIISCIPDPDAEIYRLIAIFYLSQRNISEARLFAKRAMDLEPNWISVRFVVAVINFWSSVSLSVIPPYLVSWPEPIDPAYVLRDVISIDHLRNAQAAFQDLIQYDNTPWVSESTAWYLAAISIDVDKYDEARNLCRELSGVNPGYVPPLIWSIAYGFEVDLNSSIQVLKTELEHKTITLSQTLALLDCLAHQNEFDEALNVLRQSEDSFEQVQSSFWIFRRMYIYLIKKDIEAMRDVFNDAHLTLVQQDELRELLLFGAAIIDENWEKYAQYCETKYVDTSNPNFLFKACEARFKMQDWQYVISWSQKLTREFYTYDVSRMLIDATRKAEQYFECLELIINHKSKFNRFDVQIEQCRVDCLDRSGQIEAAIEIAHEIINKVKDDVNLANLAMLLYKDGNTEELLSVAVDLLDITDGNPSAILQVAELVATERKQIAVELWENIDQEKLPDELVPPALLLGLRLGLDAQTEQLSIRMQALANNGQFGVWLMDFKALADVIRERQEFINEVSDEYLQGKITTHELVNQGFFNLFEAYNGNLDHNAEKINYLKKTILMARHGSKPIFSIRPEDLSHAKLYIDLSALILADYLDILEEVEAVFEGRLFLPASVHIILSNAHNSLSPNNPEQIKAASMVKRLVEKKKSITLVQDLVAYSNLEEDVVREIGEEKTVLYLYAKSKDAYVVDFLPLKKPGLEQDLASVDERIEERFISPRTISEILEDHGYSSWKGVQNNPTVRHQPTISKEKRGSIVKGTNLICAGGLAIYLAQLGLLEEIVKYFSVFVIPAEIEMVEEKLRTREIIKSYQRTLKDLNKRINQGRKSGIYQLIPLDSNIKDIGEIPSSLLTILGNNTEKEELNLKWIDDRFIQGQFPQVNTIIGINEVLKFLLTAGKDRGISERKYYSCIHILRKSNVRYIPIELNELLFWLNDTLVVNQSLQPSDELQTLKRYIAICVLQNEYLQRPNQKGQINSNGEYYFSLQVMRLVSDALLYTWQNYSDVDKCIAFSNWLLDYIFADFGIVYNQTEEVSSQTSSMYAIISNIITMSFTLTNNKQRMLSWLHARLIDVRSINDPKFIPNVALHIGRFLREVRRDLLDNHSDPDQKTIILLHLQQVYTSLPKVFQDVLSKDRQLLKELGYSIGSFIYIGDIIHFDEYEFRSAIYRAVNTGQALIETNLNEVAELSYGNMSNRNLVFIKLPGEDTKEELSILIPEILSDNHNIMIKSVEEKKFLLDLSSIELEKLKRDLPTQHPTERMKNIESIIDLSAVYYYQNLLSNVIKQGKNTWHFFIPPSADSLLKYLRITNHSDNSIQYDIEKGVASFLLDEGAIETFIRFSCVPIKMPNQVYDELNKMNDSDLKIVIKKLLGIQGSLISLAHLIRLLTNISDRDPVYLRLAHYLSWELISERGQQLSIAFIVILRWAVRVILKIPNMRDLRSDRQLLVIWVHSHMLLTHLRSNFELQDIIENFQNAEVFVGKYQIYQNTKNFWFDANHPYRISGIKLLIMSTGYAFGINNIIAPTPNFLTRLQDMATLHEGNFDGPHLDLLILLNQNTNMLGSFVGDDLSLYTLKLFESDFADLLTDSTKQNIVHNAIKIIDQDEANLEAWVTLDVICSDLPIFSEEMSDLYELLFNLDFTSILEQDFESWYIAMDFAVKQVDNLGKGNYEEILLSSLYGGISFLGKMADDDSTQTRIIKLLNLIVNFNIRLFTDADWTIHLSETLSYMINECNVSIPYVEELLVNLRDYVSVDQFTHLVKTLIHIRSIA